MQLKRTERGPWEHTPINVHESYLAWMALEIYLIATMIDDDWYAAMAVRIEV